MREYLSARQRDDPEHGCPSATLLDEIGRCRALTKQAYTEGVLGIADEIAARQAPNDPESARAMTLSLFALLIGTLQLSRSLADRQLADEVLERGRWWSSSCRPSTPRTDLNASSPELSGKGRGVDAEPGSDHL